MISLRTFAQTAFTGAVIGLTALTSSSMAHAAPADPWGDEQAIVDAFPDLLPAEPFGTGFNDMLCGPDTEIDEEGVTALVACFGSDGELLTINEYTDAAAAENTSYVELGTVVDFGTGTGYTAYELPYGTEYGAFVGIVFDDSERSNFVMLVGKEGATIEELTEAFADAPIGSVEA